jgi:prepilin-type N-terminal cleavage/methylation domain-containing protein
MSPHRSARGFTLVEVMAAIALSGLVVSGGVLLLRQLGDEADRIRIESADVARQGNGERLLRALTRNAEATSDTSRRFRGDERSASYRSWCSTPSGWNERCTVLLVIDQGVDSSTIIAELSSGEHLRLLKHRGAVEFRYVDPSAHDSAWTRYWGQSLKLPTAIAIVRSGDTLVFPLGASRD